MREGNKKRIECENGHRNGNENIIKYLSKCVWQRQSEHLSAWNSSFRPAVKK